MMLPSNGQFCDCCGVCADLSCQKKVDQTLKCKDKVNKVSVPTTHLWVKGNLPTVCMCLVCKEDVDYHTEPGLHGYRCCWCQRCTHTECFSAIQEISSDRCDFGAFKNMIIPPSSLVVTKTRGSRKLQLTAITAPESLSNWTPLFVVGKQKIYTILTS